MGEGYVLEWLDTLISVTLNPEKNNVALLPPNEIKVFENNLDVEKYKLMALIKNMVFNLSDNTKIKSAIKLYYSSLIVLLDQALKNQTRNSENPQLKPISDKVVECVNEIILLIESRFSNFLEVHERMPKTSFESEKKELLARINSMKQKLKDFPLCRPACEILIKVLLNVLNYQSVEHSITFREVKYIKELCLEIENLKKSERNKTFSKLDELLIYLNFNSRLYFENLIQRLTKEINSYEKKEHKIERLQFHLKLVKQLPRKSDVIFNPRQPDLKKFISNWFHCEILYLEKNIHLIDVTTNLSKSKVAHEKSIQKVMCSLSTDQTGLIIRAADELRVLMAKSMSEVFKTIVPHLSTHYKKDLSYDGMRSKSYVAEERDKQIAIKTLQEIIKKIEGY